MKFFSKTQESIPECLFKKHNISSGNIKIANIFYWDKLKKICISFDITADGSTHRFSTSVLYTPSNDELLDNAFKNIESALDEWLSIKKQLVNLKNSLEGKVVFEF